MSGIFKWLLGYSFDKDMEIPPETSSRRPGKRKASEDVPLGNIHRPSRAPRSDEHCTEGDREADYYCDDPGQKSLGRFMSTSSRGYSTLGRDMKVIARPVGTLHLVGAGDAKVPDAQSSTDTLKKPHPEWSTKPNKRALEILGLCAGDVALAAEEIREELHEREYSFRDIEIRDGLWQVMDKIERFAKQFFGFEFGDPRKLTRTFSQMLPETVKLIGSIASSGPSGADGWRELFYHEQQRRALVCGIIGKMLVEQVLQHPFFGGSKQDQLDLGDIQDKMHKSDGFERHAQYAKRLRSTLNYESRHHSGIHLPPGFHQHAAAITGAIIAHLRPVIQLDPSRRHEDTLDVFDPEATKQIYHIVAYAGILSLLMKLDPHTVYYWAPVFKEDSFSRNYMECFNRKQMEATNPRERISWPVGTVQAEKKRAKGDEAIVKITLMDGCTAYRVGGWETLESTPESVLYEEKDGKMRGVRTRILTHQWVYCRWGRPRRFKEGKPNDEAREHGQQWKGGFVEFTDVVGGKSERAKQGRRRPTVR